MTVLATEAREFRERKERERCFAAARVALQMTCRVDLESAIAAPDEARRLVRERLGRLIEKERLKGARRHWSYDLNRHIALKQALDLLSEGCERSGTREDGPKRKRPR